MARRKTKRTKPAPEPDQTPEPVPIHTHGPHSRPPERFGRDRLRQVLNLSPEADTDRICEDAAAEIERLRPLAEAASSYGQDW